MLLLLQITSVKRIHFYFYERATNTLKNLYIELCIAHINMKAHETEIDMRQLNSNIIV